MVETCPEPPLVNIFTRFGDRNLLVNGLNVSKTGSDENIQVNGTLSFVSIVVLDNRKSRCVYADEREVSIGQIASFEVLGLKGTLEMSAMRF